MNYNIFKLINLIFNTILLIFILSTFVFIFQRGIKIAKESTDTFGILLAIGISFNFILYGFINAGQNIIRTLEEKGLDKGKKYLEYLVKHNII